MPQNAYAAISNGKSWLQLATSHHSPCVQQLQFGLPLFLHTATPVCLNHTQTDEVAFMFLANKIIGLPSFSKDKRNRHQSLDVAADTQDWKTRVTCKWVTTDRWMSPYTLQRQIRNQRVKAYQFVNEWMRSMLSKFERILFELICFASFMER